MALINCPECGKEVSDRASACIHCGCPIAKESSKKKSIGKNIDFEFKGSANIVEDKILPFIKRFDRKTLLIACAVIIAVIVGIILISTSGSSGGFSGFSAKEIVLDEVHKINGIGELEVKRVSTTDRLYDETPENKTYVDFECIFTNTTKTMYSLSKLATVSAKSTVTGAEYTEFEVGLLEEGYSSLQTADIEPNVKSRVHFGVQVPENEEDLIVTINFGEESISFKYTVGELLRNFTDFKVGETYKVDNAASVTLSNVVYSDGVWAPNAVYGRTHNGYSVNNPGETAYLIFDVDYINLKNVNKDPSDVVRFEALCDGRYYTDEKIFYVDGSDNDYIRQAVYSDNDFIPDAKKRVFFVLEVPKNIINKEVEFDIFIGDTELVYKGTPAYVEDYGM